MTPTAIIVPQQRRGPASTDVSRQRTARLLTRRSRRPAWLVPVILGLLVLSAAALTWLAGRTSPAGHPASGRTPPQSSAGSWLAGTWVGSARQPTGVVTHWTAELTFSRSGRAGTFRFPSLDCSGTLIVTGTTPTTASVYEDLTRNPQKVCARGGLMTLSRWGATGMRMRWQDATNRSNVAIGYLKPG